ncbi:MAG: hypothetical protein PHQ35_09665 [Phycisphaerae bacterium]|nr:hypothetical protein [Phycisphaerae bacterium]
MQVKFKNWLCNTNVAHYSNKRTAIVLTDSEDGSPIATATVNIPEEKIEPDEIIVKDYSENEGMLKALTDVGIVIKVVRMVSTGYVECPVCKVNLELLNGK